MIIPILAICVIMLIVLCAVLFIKISIYKNKLYAQNDMFLYYKNKLSMVEYHYRNFREGQNPYTTFRHISDVLKDFYRD